MNYLDMRKVKIRHTLLVSIGTRAGMDIEEVVVCVCRGHILPSEVERYAIRKLSKKYGIDDFMRMESAVDTLSSEVVTP